MPNIYRVVRNYQPPFSSINTIGESVLGCKKLDLYRSMVTVGNPSFLSLQKIRDHGLARALYDSIIKKVAIVANNIQSDQAGIRRHQIFDTYVSDEKRIVSYNLGMAFAKLYSEKLLGIPNLVHIEFLKKQNAVTFVQQAGGKRPKEPDLVGQTIDGNWHIFEAKGVSSSVSQLNGKITEAKSQIQQVSTIHGMPPSTGSACATYIGRDRIITYLEDPPSDGDKKIEINVEKFIDAYYAPFLIANETLGLRFRTERIDGVDVDFYDLSDANRKLSIGLEREVLESIRSKKYDLPQSITSRLKEHYLAGEGQDRYSVGLDGFVVGYTDH